MYMQSGQIILLDKMFNYERVRVTFSLRTGSVSVFSYYRDIKITKVKRTMRIEEARKIMQGLKSNGCAICGYNKCLTSLVFHHVNPYDKSFQLSQNSLSKPNKVLVEELNKCILLCANCHGEIHTLEKELIH